LAIRFRTAVLLIRRLITLAFNVAYTGNTCFNCEKLGYYIPDCSLPYAFYAKLKKLKKLLKSNSEDNKHLTDKIRKNTF
jgi:hypothetical protein